VRIDVNGMGLEVAVDGREDGPPVVLLHGFPDRGRLWRNQMPALVDAGFRVIVPDQRGYGGSDKPGDVEAYGIPYLAGDILGLLDYLGVARAHVVGHDWGAAVAWAVGSLAGDRVDHLVAMSVGHPTGFFAGPGYAQREKSWYMLLFQFPGVAEQWLSGDGWAGLRSWSGHPDIEGVIADLERDGSLTSGLNWYRANITPEAFVGPPLELPPVAAPTMGIWSSDDFALNEEQMTGSAAYVSGPWRYERIDGPGHWMQLEAPDRVNTLLLDFLGG
jgi:pimeloyl-ACP methyl ester carboxylesterase